MLQVVDEFIDVESLKSLDGYTTEKIKRHAKAQEDALFDMGILTVKAARPKKPGSRIIDLSRSTRP